MALTANNINTTNVGTEIGSSSDTVSGLVGATGLNKYSFYAPGALTVNASTKCIVLTPPANNFKLGDFRLYDHSAIAIANSGTGVIQLGGGTAPDFMQSIHLYDLNLEAIYGYGNYIRLIWYKSSAGRAAETSGDIQHSQIFPITWITPEALLTGHTRTNTTKPDWVQLFTVTGFNLTGLTSSSILYKDSFICDEAGNRKVSFGTSIAANYTETTCNPEPVPAYIYASGSLTGAPSPYDTWTKILRLYATSSQCSFTGNPEVTGTTLSIYFKCMRPSPKTIIYVNHVHIYLQINDEDPQLVYQGALEGDGSSHVTYTLSPAHTWVNGDIGKLYVDNTQTDWTGVYDQVC